MIISGLMGHKRTVYLLSHWDLDKIVDICKRRLHIDFPESKVLYFGLNSLNLIPIGSIDNVSIILIDGLARNRHQDIAWSTLTLYGVTRP